MSDQSEGVEGAADGEELVDLEISEGQADMDADVIGGVVEHKDVNDKGLYG